MESYSSHAASEKPASDKVEFGFHHIIEITEPGQNRIKPGQWPECCIYRVPAHLRKEKPEAYTPQLVSIGPMHYNYKMFKSMQQEKYVYFSSFRKRLSEKGTDLQKLESYYNDVLKKEQYSIRRCYSEEFGYLQDEDKFAEMMLLDAVFIMELFLRTLEGNHNDHMFTRWKFETVLLDLQLLENQLPINVLVKLYDSVVLDPYQKNPYLNHGKPALRFLDLACYCFASFLPQDSYQDCASYMMDWKHSRHFTDMIRCFYLRSDLKQNRIKDSEKQSSKQQRLRSLKNHSHHLEKESTYDVIRQRIAQKFNSVAVGFDASSEGCYEVLKTASKLDKAGVCFEKVQDRGWLDIKFEKHWLLEWLPFLSCIPYVKCFKARLVFPQLIVDFTTERLLRNLIALEQLHYPENAFISGYVRLLDCLINIKEDVHLLVEKQVIVHTLSRNEDVSDLANSLCKNLPTSPECYGKLVERLNAHYYNKWNRTMATLKSGYFPDLWRGSATLVGLVILFFSCYNFYRNFHK